MAAFSATAGFGRKAGARGAGRRTRASLASRIPITALAVVALSTGLLRARAADPTGPLRLLVPLVSGSEHGQLVKLFPEAEVVKRDGRDYLMIGSYSDARQAYRAGRRMQQSLPMRFVITYPVNHPQANGRWIAAEEAAELAASRQAAQQQVAAREAQQAAAQTRAAQLGPTLQASNPILDRDTMAAASPTPTQAPAQSPAPAEPAAPTPAPARPQAQAQEPVLVAALNPRGLLEPQARPEPVTVATPEPQPEPQPRPELVRAVVATPRPQEQEAPAPEPAWVRKPEASTSGQSEQPALALASPPLSRRRLNLLATNPQLVYVFAELASRDDVDCLQKRMPVSDVVERDGKLLAQVGIYTTSRKGRVLRRQLEEQLRADGIQVVRMGAA